MVDQAVLGSVALGLETVLELATQISKERPCLRSEQSLLGTKNLDCGGRVLGQVGQRTSLGDETSANSVADQSSQVGCDLVHPASEVVGELLAVGSQGCSALSEGHDDLHISSRKITTHGCASSFDDGGCDSLIVVNDGGEIVGIVIRQAGLVADGKDNLGVVVVALNDLRQLGEVPSVVLTETHAELVQLEEVSLAVQEHAMRKLTSLST